MLSEAIVIEAKILEGGIVSAGLPLFSFVDYIRRQIIGMKLLLISLQDASYQNEIGRGYSLWHVVLGLDVYKLEYNGGILWIGFPLLSIPQIWGKKDSVCLCMYSHSLGIFYSLFSFLLFGE